MFARPEVFSAHACQMFSVPSIYGRRSHLCDMANSSSGRKVLFLPMGSKANGSKEGRDSLAGNLWAVRSFPATGRMRRWNGRQGEPLLALSSLLIELRARSSSSVVVPTVLLSVPAAGHTWLHVIPEGWTQRCPLTINILQSRGHQEPLYTAFTSHLAHGQAGLDSMSPWEIDFASSSLTV
jgi:hypothetical protein